ncbi:MAG: hypothetical protein RMJ89_00570, partial [Flammeovirgaceae bacterium]|nr:hypothetical protein [Flammeovirgaceae bacterium]
MSDEKQFTIRKANDGDVAVIVDFQLKMAWETEKLKLDEPTLTKGVESVLRNPDRGYYWIVEDGKT